MKKLLTLAIPLVLLVFVGCKGPAGPEGPACPEKIYVMGEVSYRGNADVEVYFSPVIPWVTVNQETLDLYMFYGADIWYRDSISINPGDSLHLKVDWTKGVATASSWVPGSFEVTSHDTSQMVYIPVDSAFTVTWSTSNHADFYRVDFYIGYEYIDTLGNYRWFYLEKDTCVTSTSITFPASQLFPGDLDSVTYAYSWGDFDIWAMNGPMLEPGSEGNVKGDGSGFFWCESYGGDLDIQIEGTKAKAKREEPTKEELMKKWFEKAKATNPNYEALREALQR